MDRMSSDVKRVKILGVKVDALTKDRLLEKAIEYIEGRDQNYIVTTNSEFIVCAEKDDEFKKIINFSDLSIPDGGGIIWADYFLKLPVEIPAGLPKKKRRAYRRRKIRAQFLFSLMLNLIYPWALKKRIPQRLSGADFVLSLCPIMAKKNCSLYLLGGSKEESVAYKFGLEKMFPDLIISGIKGGFSREDIPNEELVKAVNKAKPEILLVALGHPYQEKWIYHNLDKVPSVKLAVGVGGTLDYLSGRKKRAPKALQKLNLEWLWRLILEPKRWRRVKNAVIVFPRQVYRYKTSLFGGK